MRKKGFIQFLFLPALICMLLMGVFGCEPESCDQVEPAIEYESFKTSGDSGILVVSFKDCDGDVGLPRDHDTGDYEYNFFIDYYRFSNGEWSLVELTGDTSKFHARVPKLETKSNSDILEGEIEIQMGAYYLDKGDTLRYEVYLKDRALHTSNVVTTPTIIAPPADTTGN